VFVLVLVLGLVGLALESGLSARREENAAQARIQAREAAEAGASRAFMALAQQYQPSTGFTNAITTGGGRLGWPLRQRFGQGSTWKVLVVNNDDSALGGSPTKDVDGTCVLYVTGRAPAPSGGDAIYNLVKVIRLGGGQPFPAYYAGGGGAGGNAIVGVAFGALSFKVAGKYGNLRVDGSLVQAVGSITAKDITYGGGYLNLLGSATPAPHFSAVSPQVPTQTSLDAWNAAKAAGGNNYALLSNGTIQDGNGNPVGSAPWSGWTFNIATGWTHTGGDFAPAGVPATFYARGGGILSKMTILGGNNATASFLSEGSVAITGLAASLAITPRNGVTIFADQDVLLAGVLGGLSLGTAANPGYIVAGEQTLLEGVLGPVSVQGAVIAKDLANASPLVLADTVLGNVTITEDTVPGFVLGTPTLGTVVAYEAIRDPAVALPVDASEGSLGVYR
jgi:hypothetical protein